MFIEAKPLPPEPKLGDLRRRQKFAWLPVKVEGGRVWWEYYFRVDIYRQYRAYMPECRTPLMCVGWKHKENVRIVDHVSEWIGEDVR